MATVTKAARSNLTPAQSKKLDTVVASLVSTLKVKGEDRQKALGRFADKYARFKLGVRGTGPHSHGFNTGERKAITEAVRNAFGIKVAPRKAAAPKVAAKKGSANKRGSTRKSTAQLAKEQTARAGQPIAGTVVVRQGS
jgi:hypothetical protein